MQEPSGLQRHGSLAPVALWVVFAICVCNAFAFQHAVVAPMLAADNWLFADTFLRHALEGPFDLGDYLVKRAGVDHAQPVSKLLMLWNYRVFGLDFRIEGIVGLLFGVAGVLVLYRMAMTGTRSDQRSWGFHWLLAAVAAVHLSLNSSAIYSSSMVTLGFVPFFFAFATIFAAWHAIERGRWQWLLATTLVYGVIGDNSAVLLVAVLAPVMAVYGWRTGRTAAAWRMVLMMLVAVAICRIFYAVFGEIRGATLPEFNVPLTERIAGLVAQWRDWWQFVLVPAASGLAYAAPLQNLLGEDWRIAQISLGAAVLVAHVWFWWRASQTQPSAVWFLAVALMLLFYAYLAGLLMTRVFVPGAGYLDQPRYVSFYQIGIIALLLMGCARALQTRASDYWRSAVAGMVVLLQLPLSWSANREVVHIQHYYVTYSAQLRELVRNPASPPADCLPTLTLCPAPLDLRLRVLHMLRDHEANIFSPRFRREYPDYYVDPQSLN